jgi:hypothetical protein
MDGADLYTVLVYARSVGSALPYEKTFARTYCLVEEAPVTSVALAADLVSPQPAGTALTFTAAAASGGAGGVEYQFWLSTGAGGPYVPVGDATTGYSPADTWHWTPPAAGAYRVLVYARTAGSIAPYEATRVVAFTAN